MEKNSCVGGEGGDGEGAVWEQRRGGCSSLSPPVPGSRDSRRRCLRLRFNFTPATTKIYSGRIATQIVLHALSIAYGWRGNNVEHGGAGEERAEKWWGGCSSV